MSQGIPFNSEASHTGLLGENIAADVLNLGLRRGLGGQFFRVVLVVHIVAHTDEFTTVVAAGEEDDSDAQNLRRGNPFEIGSISLEDELVHSDRDRTDEERVEFLVMLRAREKSVSGNRGWRQG